jgi:hypothetical protein
MSVGKLIDRLNAPLQGTAADGLKLALAVLWERRDECPGAVPVLVCHDEVVFECDADQAADAKTWLEKAMIEGMEVILNGTDARSAGTRHAPRPLDRPLRRRRTTPSGRGRSPPHPS